MIKQNYQRQLDDLLDRLPPGGHLLLHSCCAPCSTYVLDYLAQHFQITLFFYNPNILPQSEYEQRLQEQKRLLTELETLYPITLLEGTYEPHVFLKAVQGQEHLPEGGERCTTCYRLRLSQAAKAAHDVGADYFTTTLSVSPYKDAQRLNQIAAQLEDVYGVPALPSDFKKKDGYKKSVALSRQYDLYRQDYCGCPFSKAQRQQEKSEKKGNPHDL